MFLNGQFIPMSDAKLSPMDRGFLFGDGIYEAIPSYGGKLVGFALHIARRQEGLNAIGISLPSLRQVLLTQIWLNSLK